MEKKYQKSSVYPTCPYHWRLMVAILAANAVVTRIMIAHSTPRVVAFDMKKTLDNFMDSVSRKQLTESQSKALSDRFNDALEKKSG